MRISRVKLNNYVCFYDAPEFELGPGINFVVGKNNSGKTALLDVLSIASKGEAHRSAATLSVRNPLAPISNESSFEIELEFDEREMLQILRKRGDTFHIHNFGSIGDANFIYWNKLERYFSGKRCLQFQYTDGIAVQANAKEFASAIAFSEINGLEGTSVALDVEANIVTEGHSGKHVYHFAEDPSICWQEIALDAPSHIYYFESHRRIEQTWSADHDTDLLPDASNLAQVVHSIQTAERYSFEKLVNLLQQVFEDIREVLTYTEEGNVEISVEYRDTPPDRPDLAVKLADCGSGVEQVIAILYVLAISRTPQVIVIDEPQTYLHPDAVRRLIHIFEQEEYAHHQFIVATHSSVALAAAKQKTVLHVERNGMTSQVRTIPRDDTAAIIEVLRSVGFRLSDVYGADAIIWVEGETEPRCIPLILEKRGIDPAFIRIIPLKGSGYIVEKRADRFADLFAKVSKTIGVLPRETMILHDGDVEPRFKQSDSTRQVEVRALPRQNYESYLIEHPAILAEVLSDDDGDEPQKYGEVQVADWIKCNRSDSKYYAKCAEFSEESWLYDINGAKFLQNLFACISNHTRVYDKVDDGEEITKRILKSDPNHFSEIVDLIQSVLPNDSLR